MSLIPTPNSTNTDLFCLWQKLKSNAPAGPINIPNIMSSIEEIFQTSKPRYLEHWQAQSSSEESTPVFIFEYHVPATFQANWLFHQLHNRLAASYKKVGMTQGQRILTAACEFEGLQAAMQQRVENSALRKIWIRLAPHLQLDPNASLSDQEARNVLADPTYRDQVHSVKQLDLSNLKLKILPQEIGLFCRLRVLILTGDPNHIKRNCLQTLPKSFSNLTSLGVLDLSHNNLEQFPQSLCDLTTLRGLSISSNQLNELPESFGRLTALRELSANCNFFTELPSSFIQLISLEKLNLRNNHLIEIPTLLGRLTALQILNLNGNHLNTLPESLNNLTALRSLGLSANYLIEISLSFENFRNLEELTLDSNRLKKLPPSIGKLMALQHLDLHNNLLTQLPESFGQLLLLQYLNLNSNLLTELLDDFGNLKALIEVELGQNQLKKLPESLTNLTAATNLRLNKNQVERLPESFDKLISLKNLNLDNNSIKELPASFGNLPTLACLSLRDNNLTRLPQSFSQLTHSLKELEISGNPLLFASDQELRKEPTLAMLLYLHQESLSYSCQTDIARFYLALIQGDYHTATEVIESIPEMRDQIQFQETDLDQVAQFFRHGFFAQFDQFENKREVYLEYSRLAGYGEDAQLGEEHLFDNILRFIDAFEIVLRREAAVEEHETFNEPATKRRRTGESDTHVSDSSDSPQ